MDSRVLKFRAFITTVDEGSITKAAETLHYSQSGISRMIADLEDDWGVKLLERGRSGVTLTSDGRSVLPYARRLCAEYGELGSKIDEIHGLESGLVRIALFETAAVNWLPGILAKFRKDHPGIEFEILESGYSETEQNIADGLADLGFIKMPSKLGLTCEFLEKDELVALLPADHPLASMERIPIEEMTRWPFIMIDSSRGEISEIFEKSGLNLNISLRFGNRYSVISMVEKGIGISIIPKMTLERTRFSGAVRSLDPPQYSDFGVAYRGDEPSSSAARILLDYVKYR